MKKIRVLNVVTKMNAAGIETLLMNFYRKDVMYEYMRIYI
jgi:hypothetical protein